MIQTPAKPRFIEIEIEKPRFLIKKNNRPQITLKSAMSCPASALMHLQMPDSFDKIEKKCAGTASSCDFLREKVSNSGKT